MAKKVNQDEVAKLISTSKRTTTLKFGSEISALKKGEGLFINDNEWTAQTTMSAYYYGKLRKGIKVEDREYDYQKVKDGFLITKIK